MAINSPRDALNHILAACVADLALSGISPERRIAASAIVDAARAGLDAPDPLAPQIEALLVQARAEQMIDAGEADELRNLARRLAK